MALGKRLKQARELRGLTQEQLAIAAGLPSEARATVQAVESRDSQRTKYAGAFARALGIRLAWLQDGEGSMDGPDNPAPSGRMEGLESGPAIRGMVPVISWVRAGSWHEASDQLQPGYAEDWKPCISSHGPRTYALRVVGDSMTAPHGKSYPEGCLIFVDPDRLDPPNGTPIIAKVNGDAAVTFKILVKDGGKIYLKPLNPQHLNITDHFRVLGTVIGKWEDP